MIILAILMAFAWAIGGEKYFGKWRRGVLVAACSIAAGVCMQLPIFTLVILAAMFYLYQLLFYDDGIKMIWDEGNPWGWLLLFINGQICGLYPAVIWTAQGQWMKGAIYDILSGLAFAFICWLSNGLKWSWNGTVKIGDVAVWNPADSWWWACWIYGLMLGVMMIW